MRFVVAASAAFKNAKAFATALIGKFLEACHCEHSEAISWGWLGGYHGEIASLRSQ